MLCLELSCGSGKLKGIVLGLGAYNLLFIFLWLILVYLIIIREHVCALVFFPTAGLDSSNLEEYYRFQSQLFRFDFLTYSSLRPTSPPPLNYYKTPSTTSLSQQTKQAQQNVSWQEVCSKTHGNSLVLNMQVPIHQKLNW